MSTVRQWSGANGWRVVWTRRRRILAISVLAGFVLIAPRANAQVLLDRVVARVNDMSVTLSDVRAAVGLGLVVAKSDEMAFATEQWIQRRLLLLEVDRFPPPEPASMAIDQEEARLRRYV